MKDIYSKFASELPDLATTADLVRLGFYKSDIAAYKARKLKNSPDYIQMGKGKILYPKESIIKFLKDRTIKGTKIEE